MDPSPAAPLTALFTHPASNRHRILLALTDSESRRFLPGQPLAVLPPNWRQAYLSVPEPPAWARVLAEFNPTIIVSAWSAPRLPESYLGRPDLALQYICHLCGSIRAMVPRNLLGGDIPVTNWGSLAASAVAEHALLLGLSALRNSRRWREWLAFPTEEGWKDKDSSLVTRSLFRQRIGIHGFGKIARQLIRLLKPFETPIAVYAQGVDPRYIQTAGAQPCESLEELFASSDVLFECEALTAQSKGSVTRAMLERLPVGAVFVNVGRGALVDEPALLRLAAADQIRLALDVYAHEPLPCDSELLNLPDAILSPHIGGPTADLYPEVGRHAIENLRRFLDGRPLESLVDEEQYDRST